MGEPTITYKLKHCKRQKIILTFGTIHQQWLVFLQHHQSINHVLKTRKRALHQVRDILCINMIYFKRNKGGGWNATKVPLLTNRFLSFWYPGRQHGCDGDGDCPLPGKEYSPVSFKYTNPTSTTSHQISGSVTILPTDLQRGGTRWLWSRARAEKIMLRSRYSFMTGIKLLVSTYTMIERRLYAWWYKYEDFGLQAMSEMFH